MEIGGAYEEHIWPGDPGGQTRADRRPVRYSAFIPNPVGGYDPEIPSGLAKLLSGADSAITDLVGATGGIGAQLEVFARQLLRQEALASSRIEGLGVSQRRLAVAGFDPEHSTDRIAREVVANIKAMQRAIDVGVHGRPFRVEDLLEIHTVLMGEHAPQIAGKVRDRQNWVGGSWSNPAKAEFVPPPAGEVDRLLDDLAAFVNLDDIPTTLQAAIAHAQFETIHPFADGNGRTGRCLIHIIHRRSGVPAECVPPISLVLAGEVDRYVAGLTAYRSGDVPGWVGYFAQVTKEAAELAGRLLAATSDLQDRWRARARTRSGSTADALIGLIPGNPVIDVAAASALTGTSNEAARLAIRSLAEHGVLREVTSRARNRVWEAPDVWELLERAEAHAPPGSLA